jgi:transposase
VTPQFDERLPDDVETLKAMLLAERQARHSETRHQALLIEKLKHTIAKLRHERFGQSAERGTLLDQLELQLFELEEDEAQADSEGELATGAIKVEVKGFARRKPARRPLPEHLPRERIVHPAPSACPCCGGGLKKLGEDVTETLELIPRQWKVIQHVREKFSCRACEKISQPPAPWHTRSRAGEPARACWHTFCSPSMACTCRSIARARPMPARASNSISLPSRTGSARRRQP